MASLTTRVLLTRAAQAYVGGRRSFSKEEIVKKINEIKYLSSQKKVPKLTLRKEIIHLEHKLGIIFELEKKLLEQEQKESAKIGWLKQEVVQLKKRIASSEDKDLQQKVDTLSHLLGESLAKRAVLEDVALQEKMLQNERETARQLQKKKELAVKLLTRLETIKQEIAALDLDPALVQRILVKIRLIENKIHSLASEGGKTAPAAAEEKIKEEELKHTMIFHAPPPQSVEIDELALERELPLPPPPRIVG